MIQDLASDPETGIDRKGNATVWCVRTRRCQKADESRLEQIVEFMYPILRQSVVNLTRNLSRQRTVRDNQLVWLLGSRGRFQQILAFALIDRGDFEAFTFHHHQSILLSLSKSNVNSRRTRVMRLPGDAVQQLGRVSGSPKTGHLKCPFVAGVRLPSKL
jgi:hypothetical protein